MENPLPEHSYKDLKLIALIEALIACEDESENRILQDEFYCRLREKFFDRCYKVTTRIYRGTPDIEAIRDDVLQETFITALAQVKTFDMKDHWDDKECKKVLLFWLSEIANRKLLKQKAVESKEKEYLNNYLYHVLSENSNGSIGKRKYKPTYDRTKFDEVWSKMNQMSKDILFLCLEHETLSEENSAHLPSDEISKLIKKYGVSKAAIRKAKQRALTAIKSCKIEN
ncbi:MAG: hypothetical protein JSS98_12860 [Bacteroidetes bacterium]|nr:hypothetical protein [Bacteroidota bacterium]